MPKRMSSRPRLPTTTCWKCSRGCRPGSSPPAECSNRLACVRNWKRPLAGCRKPSERDQLVGQEDQDRAGQGPHSARHCRDQLVKLTASGRGTGRRIGPRPLGDQDRRAYSLRGKPHHHRSSTAPLGTRLAHRRLVAVSASRVWSPPTWVVPNTTNEHPWPTFWDSALPGPGSGRGQQQPLQQLQQGGASDDPHPPGDRSRSRRPGRGVMEFDEYLSPEAARAVVWEELPGAV